jgi:hypothetical protein
MPKRIPQPPVNPALRSAERHDFWPGFVAVVAGLLLLGSGARHLTGLGTVQGGTATEFDLVKAFATGGLQFAEKLPPPKPPRGNDPAALARWLEQSAHPETPAWKVRVDTESAAACPT